MLVCLGMNKYFASKHFSYFGHSFSIGKWVINEAEKSVYFHINNTAAHLIAQPIGVNTIENLYTELFKYADINSAGQLIR